MNLNEIKIQSLTDLGFSGPAIEMEMAWLAANTGNNYGTYNERWMDLLGNAGYTGSLQERQMKAWSNNGLVGSWNEMARQFWEGGADLGSVIEDPVFIGPDVNDFVLFRNQAMAPVDLSDRFTGGDLSYGRIGVWPAGVNLSIDGIISGTPNGVPSTHPDLSVFVQNALGQALSNDFIITVNPEGVLILVQQAGANTVMVPPITILSPEGIPVVRLGTVGATRLFIELDGGRRDAADPRVVLDLPSGVETIGMVWHPGTSRYRSGPEPGLRLKLLASVGHTIRVALSWS